mmetsp:Transcript_17684/g.25947  ORF Transcript_17684/g.25947 Transcript_17684/m.25947 type:complete len:534 (+) Transcript_17684:97-1698(+)
MRENNAHGHTVDPFQCWDVIIAMLANFSTSYNVVNISYVLCMLHQEEELGNYNKEQENENVLDDSMCASAILIGMIIGQLSGGALGDWIGRHGAIALMIVLQIVSSIGSIFSAPIVSSNVSIFVVLSIWRFVLGIGCGGVYPLAAILTAESASSGKERERLVSLTFSTQGVAFLCAPMITWFLTYVTWSEGENCREGTSNSILWKIVLGIGCIPGLVVIGISIHLYSNEGSTSQCGIWKSWKTCCERYYLPVGNKTHADGANTTTPQNREMKYSSSSWTLRSISKDSSHDDGPSILPSSEEETRNQVYFDANKTNVTEKRTSHFIFTAILSERKLCQKLCGTALCWFLFDVLFYGNTLFTPVVLDQAFGNNGTSSSPETNAIFTTARDATILALVALPGYYVSVSTIGQCQTPKFVQCQGFAAMGVLYGIIGLWFERIKQRQWLLLLLYGLTFFFANYGPNTTTFMLPSITFSPSCRATLNGISAACGKLGALLGASMFEPTAERFGDATVMIICSGISFMAFFFVVVLPRVS